MTTTEEVAGALDTDAVLDLVDTEPVPLVEVEDDDDYEQRAAEHFGAEDPHDDADVLADVELSEDA